MREDPLPNKPDAPFHGDNFHRSSGDTNQFKALNLHSVHASERGQDIHMQGAPSQAEHLYREFKQRKEKLEDKISSKIIDRYGDASANAEAGAPDRDMLLGQTETFVEYDRAGRVVNGSGAPAALSRWDEDVLINNHTSVWGSFWSDGQWGYACCHQMVKNSWCTGAAGRQADAQAEGTMLANVEKQTAEAASRRAAQARLGVDGEDNEKGKPPSWPRTLPPAWGCEGDQAVQVDREKLEAAMRLAVEAEREGVELDERKRTFNSMRAGDNEVTPEEMEAYRMKKSRGLGEDPMAAAGADGGSSGAGGYEYV